MPVITISIDRRERDNAVHLAQPTTAEGAAPHACTDERGERHAWVLRKHSAFLGLGTE